MKILIVVSIIVGIYLLISIITSAVAYSIVNEVAVAFAKLVPDEYEKSRLYKSWRLPRWHRIKECMKIGFVPIANIFALWTSVTKRNLMLTQLLAVYREDIETGVEE